MLLSKCINRAADENRWAFELKPAVLKLEPRGQKCFFTQGIGRRTATVASSICLPRCKDSVRRFFHVVAVTTKENRTHEKLHAQNMFKNNCYRQRGLIYRILFIKIQPLPGGFLVAIGYQSSFFGYVF